MLMATDVETVALHYGKSNQKFLRTVKMEDAKSYLKEGHSPPGSMGPKVEAAIQFLQAGGKRTVIAPIEAIEEAVEGCCGTEIIKGK